MAAFHTIKIKLGGREVKEGTIPIGTGGIKGEGVLCNEVVVPLLHMERNIHVVLGIIHPNWIVGAHVNITEDLEVQVLPIQVAMSNHKGQHIIGRCLRSRQ